MGTDVDVLASRFLHTLSDIAQMQVLFDTSTELGALHVALDRLAVHLIQLVLDLERYFITQTGLLAKSMPHIYLFAFFNKKQTKIMHPPL